MEVLSSRFVIHPTDFLASRQFYEHTLELRIYHEYGNGEEVIGVVYFAGGGFIELADGTNPSDGSDLWLQVGDLEAEQARLDALGYPIAARADRMPWGLKEMIIHDPNGVRITLVEVPQDHFLRLGRF